MTDTELGRRAAAAAACSPDLPWTARRDKRAPSGVASLPGAKGVTSPASEPRNGRAAELVGGLLLAMPGCRLSFTVWGSRSIYPTQLFGGEGHWPFLRRLVTAMSNIVADPRASAGALQRVCATGEPAYLVAVTPWVEPEHRRFLPVPYGGTCILVGAKRSWLGRHALGVSDPLLVLQPPDAAHARDEDRVAQLASVCEQRRIELIELPGRGEVLEELETILLKSRQRHLRGLATNSSKAATTGRVKRAAATFSPNSFSVSPSGRERTSRSSRIAVRVSKSRKFRTDRYPS